MVHALVLAMALAAADGGAAPEGAGKFTVLAVPGGIDAKAVQTAVLRNMNVLGGCFERELLKKPGIGGVVTVAFAIARDGRVKDAKLLDTTMHEAAVEACLVKEIARVRFPRVKRGPEARVTYPFKFSSSVEGADGGAAANVVTASSGTVVEGNLSRDQVDAVIEGRRADLGNCFAAAQQANPNFQGDLVVSFIIAASGAVSRADVRSGSAREPAFEKCVLGGVRGWKFPKPRGGGSVVVTHPFVFSAAEQAPAAGDAGPAAPPGSP